MGDGSFSCAIDADGERAGETDRCECHVVDGEGVIDGAVGAGAVHQPREHITGGHAPIGPVRGAKVRHEDVDDTEAAVDGRMEVVTERLTTVALLRECRLAGRHRPVDRIHGRGVQQVVDFRKVAVERRDADARGAGDRLARGRSAHLEDQVGGGVDDASSIAERVSTGHETEYNPPLMSPEDTPLSIAGRDPVTFDHCDHVRTSFFHGTTAVLSIGDLLMPGHRSNYHDGRIANHVYFAALLEPAVWGAELAVALSNASGPGHIYVVDPTGPFEDDPNVTDKKFPGNITRSYRTREPVRIVGRLADWEAHSPEVLQAMLDSIARLRAQGLDVIDD